ncbi:MULTISPECIES: hypothetical protein [unclassified Bradyrhizobium]
MESLPLYRNQPAGNADPMNINALQLPMLPLDMRHNALSMDALRLKEPIKVIS